MGDGFEKLLKLEKLEKAWSDEARIAAAEARKAGGDSPSHQEAHLAALKGRGFEEHKREKFKGSETGKEGTRVHLRHPEGHKATVEFGHERNANSATTHVRAKGEDLYTSYRSSDRIAGTKHL
jgi:hypothetical protein